MSDGSSESTASEPAAPTMRIGLTTGALVYVTAALTLVIAVVAMFDAAEEAMTRIVIGTVLALALDPLVRSLQRRGMRRRAAAATVGLGVVVVALLVVLLVGPPAVEQAQQFSDELPQTIQEFYGLPLGIGDWLQDNDASGKLETFVAELPSQVDDETVNDTANSLLRSALGVAIVLAVMFAVMFDGETLIARFRSLIRPAHRARADRFGRVMYNTFGNYFGGSVTVAVMSGMWTLTIALIFDVPLAPVAAIWSMVTNVIPQIGGFLGGSFVTVLALSVSVPTAIIVCVLFVAYMNFENNVIQPAIIGNAVDLSPPVSMLAVLIGGAAGGIPGALVATPLVGAAKRIYFEIRGREGEDQPEPSPSLSDRVNHLLHRDKADANPDKAAA